MAHETQYVNGFGSFGAEKIASHRRPASHIMIIDGCDQFPPRGRPSRPASDGIERGRLWVFPQYIEGLRVAIAHDEAASWDLHHRPCRSQPSGCHAQCHTHCPSTALDISKFYFQVKLAKTCTTERTDRSLPENRVLSRFQSPSVVRVNSSSPVRLSFNAAAIIICIHKKFS